MIPKLAKTLAQSIGRGRIVDATSRLVSWSPDSRRDLLRVLTYHRIDDVDARQDLDPSLISATPKQFAEQIRWIAREFEPVSLSDVLESIGGRTSLPQRAVLVTFDDAYQDFEQHAWPVLARHGVPATLFVPTAFPENAELAFWWDRLHCALIHSDSVNSIDTPWGPIELTNMDSRKACLRRLKQRLKMLPAANMDSVVDDICTQCNARPPARAVMTWPQLKALSIAGTALVPHTHTHPLLNRIPLEIARDEIIRSRQELADRIGNVLPAFAYPSGHFDESVAQLMASEGFQLAFTTVRGLNDLTNCDPLRLRRANVGRSTPDSLIRLQLLAVARHLQRPLPTSFPEEKQVHPLG